MQYKAITSKRRNIGKYDKNVSKYVITCRYNKNSVILLKICSKLCIFLLGLKINRCNKTIYKPVL